MKYRPWAMPTLRNSGLTAIALLACWMYVAGQALAVDVPNVTITGGADPSGYKYTWVVNNKHLSPIVYIEFPHYHGALFFAPDGWVTECTALVNVGYKDEQGTCSASAEAPAAGVAPKRSTTFDMRIARLPTRRGKGTVLIRFADGVTTRVRSVELPVRESVGDKYAPLIGLGTIFLVWMIIRSRRRARVRRSNVDASAPDVQDADGDPNVK